MPDKQYNDANRGVAFKNDKRESENHPNWKGKINVEGKDYWFSMWEKTSQRGDDYFSMSVQVMQPKQEKKDWVKPELRQKFEQPEEVVLDDIDDEPVDMSAIPF
jgi:uncharacterized protein (DUF736 family)